MSRNAKAVAVLLAVLATSAFADPLRIVQDPVRNHTWRLERDAVYLGERRIELPGWMHADEKYACRPDLAVDAQGAAVVTSNVVPILWRIDPQTLRVSQRELILDSHNKREVGFTGLAYAADQEVFFAVSGTQGTLWRIDPLLRGAQQILVSEPLRNACGLAIERTKTRRNVVFCLRGPEPRRVYLTPDQRAAYVRNNACLEQSANPDIAFIK